MAAAVVSGKRSCVEDLGAGERPAKRQRNFSALFGEVATYSNRGHRRIYLNTGEGGVAETLTKMRKLPVGGDTIVATSALFSLNLFAARARTAEGLAPQHLVIVDCSPVVKQFWRDLRFVVMDSESRSDCHSRIEKLVSDGAEFYFPSSGCWNTERVRKGYLKGLQARIHSGQSFLSNHASFDKVKAMFERGNFAFVQGNLLCPDTYRDVQAGLAMGGHSVDTYYLSCLFAGPCVYASRETRERIKEVLSPSARVIQAEGPDGFHWQEVNERFQVGDVCERLWQRVFQMRALRRKAEVELAGEGPAGE